MFDVRSIARYVITPRMMFGNIFLYCLGMIIVARFYFQGYLSLDPCPLCVVQRFFVIGTSIVVLAAFLHNPGILGRRIYTSVALLPNVIGIITAIRHVWLQNLPSEQVPECGPGIDYIMEVFSLFEALKMIFSGSGECSEILWVFLGLTIPGWTLVAFLIMGAALFFQLFRRD